ncbi:MAG: YkgJ family cysteine cluster protein [Treponemataceae bacterium]|nr:YkgJ family cysteine cluster protein [Treponemataceae bacterium]
MSEIIHVLEKLEGTSEEIILKKIEGIYEQISEKQKSWYDSARFFCPSGCGTCCHGFEPDLFKSEVLYMAAWLLENQNQVAMQIVQGLFPFENGKTCPFFNPENDYHCSIYGGRALICRLFGASSVKDKHDNPVWKPCKFIPLEDLKKYDSRLEHRQYNYEELMEILGSLPPVMSDFTESLAFDNSVENDSSATKLIRDILPQTIRYLLWIMAMNDNHNPDDNPNSPPTAA